MFPLLTLFNSIWLEKVSQMICFMIYPPNQIDTSIFL